MRGRVTHDFRMVCKKAVAPLQTPIIILGGILVGVFTPTEASAVAVAYALIVGFFVLRTMKLRDLPRCADPLGARHLGRRAAAGGRGDGVQDRRVAVLRAANPRRLHPVAVRKPADPAVPDQHPVVHRRHVPRCRPGDHHPWARSLGPIFVDLGVHPVHFAIIMSVNLTVGLATPPMGLVLFVASTVSGEKVETIAKAILPFLAVEVLVIFLITYIPAISMTSIPCRLPGLRPRCRV